MTTNEIGSCVGTPPQHYVDGPRPISSTEAFDRLHAIVGRFERGEIGLAEAERQMQPILERLSPCDRGSAGIRSTLARFRRAREEQGQERIAHAQSQRQTTAPPGPAARLAGSLRSVRIPDGANQRAVDVAVSGAFPNGAQLLRDLRGLSESQVRRAVEAAGLRGEQADRVVESLRNRVVMALTQQTLDHVRNRFDALIRQYRQPSQRTLDQIVGELSGSSRTPALQGFAVMGVSDETLARLEALSPPADDATAAELRQVVRQALSECASAAVEERDRLLSGTHALAEWSTGDVFRTFPHAVRAAAARFGIHGEQVRSDRTGIGRAPTFVEQAIADHVDGAETRRIARGIAVVLIQRATDLAGSIASNGAGIAGTIVDLGIGAATGAIEIENADRRARLAEIAHRAGVGTEEAAREAYGQAQGERDKVVLGAAATGASEVAGDGAEAFEHLRGAALDNMVRRDPEPGDPRRPPVPEEDR